MYSLFAKDQNKTVIANVLQTAFVLLPATADQESTADKILNLLRLGNHTAVRPKRPQPYKVYSPLLLTSEES